jgi:hypothetical protein
MNIFGKPMNRRLIVALFFALIAIAGVVLVNIITRVRGEARFRAGPFGKMREQAGDVHYAKLIPAGDRIQSGIYDPSVAYTPDGSIGWLAYSSVTGDDKPVGPYVHTHLARTTDGGAHWEFVKALDIPHDGTLTMNDGKKLTGAWRYEVPSLVCDASDPDASRRWKLFVHVYFWEPKRDRMVTHGWIAMRTAADPASEWSGEIPLFGAGKNPPAPYHDTRVDLNALDVSLKNSVAYSEPGVLAHDDRLFLSMTALHPRIGLTGISVGHTIVLIASGDHGARWRFVRTLLTNDDAAHFGCNLFDGSSLAEDDGRFYLLASPGLKNIQHIGTAAFEFESLAEGRLRRDADGLPVIANYFAPQPGIFSGPGAGQSAYDPRNTGGGLIMPQFNLKAFPEVFQIFQTGRRIAPKK